MVVFNPSTDGLPRKGPRSALYLGSSAQHAILATVGHGFGACGPDYPFADEFMYDVSDSRDAGRSQIYEGHGKP